MEFVHGYNFKRQSCVWMNIIVSSWNRSNYWSIFCSFLLFFGLLTMMDYSDRNNESDQYNFTKKVRSTVVQKQFRHTKNNNYETRKSPIYSLYSYTNTTYYRSIEMYTTRRWQPEVIDNRSRDDDVINRFA